MAPSVAALDMRPDIDMGSGSTATSATVTGTASPDRALVVGSMEAAQSGQYQRIVEQVGMGGSKQVEMHMVDRLTDGATQLEADIYPTIQLVVPFAQAQSQSLLPILFSALRPGGSMALAPMQDAMRDEDPVRATKGAWTLAGFSSVELDQSTGFIVGTKSVSGGSSGSKSQALPLRRKLANRNGGGAGLSNGTSAEKKKALWMTSPATTSLIDSDSLLTEADHIAPKATRREDCDLPSALAGGRRRKACKGCTCGLRELEEEEDNARSNNIVQIDADDMDVPTNVSRPNPPGSKTEVTETMVDENGVTRVIKRITVDTNGMTSSCGSCSLGDAFRCSSCPYLGEFSYLCSFAKLSRQKR